jgi:hypothetical protein
MTAITIDTAGAIVKIEAVIIVFLILVMSMPSFFALRTDFTRKYTD